jgi:hypothetical protein
MNWIIRLGQWWENRRPVKKSEFELFKHNMHELMKEAQKTGPAVEIARLKMQVNRLELFVGLQREAKPVPTPDAPKIA